MTELSRTPPDTARSRLMAQWFHECGQHAWAAQFLEHAGGDPLMVARYEWLAGHDAKATAAFQNALAAAHDPHMTEYLGQCLAAVQHEAAGVK
jgi:hypothetical protein